VDVHYPDEAAERDIILATTGTQSREITPAMTKDDLVQLQALVRDMPVGEDVVTAIVTLVRAMRPGPLAGAGVNDYVTWAPGPRGSQGLMLAVRARALLQGRATPLLADVQALAVPVLRHRMALNFRARADGVSVSSLIATQCAAL
jgi:MoxR-like ATPase